MLKYSFYHNGSESLTLGPSTKSNMKTTPWFPLILVPLLFTPMAAIRYNYTPANYFEIEHNPATSTIAFLTI